MSGPSTSGGMHGVSHLTLTMTLPCDHCGQPIPINGPTRVAWCPGCTNETPIPEMAAHLSALASHTLAQPGDVIRVGGITVFPEPDPECVACGHGVSVLAQLRSAGECEAVPCPTCGKLLPTFAAPAWLKQLLPTAVRVFGAEPDAMEGTAPALHVGTGQSQPVAMACPSCGGGLTMTGGTARTVACPFCAASVFIPDDLWKRLHPVATTRRWTLSYTGRLLTRAEFEALERVRDQNRDAGARARAERDARKEARRALLGTRQAIVGELPRQGRAATVVVIVAALGLVVFLVVRSC